MKYFILSGEASGDLHSAALATALKVYDPDAEIHGWGGDEMQKAGVKILKHYRDLAFMGFVEVLQHLPEIMRNFRQVKEQIISFKPDVLILTDYPGFNLRMAKWAHKQGIPVHYYISPQLWAWKESRMKIVRKYVDQMYVILPFEKDFYAKHGVDVRYVGHPLAWRIDHMLKQKPERDLNKNENQNENRKRITLLPGSRRREIAFMLPVMLESVRHLQGYEITVAGAPSIPPEYYYDFIRKSSLTGMTLAFGYTYDLLRRSFAAICTSGTATLETALFNVPQVVCYKGDILSYLIARRLVKVPFIAMVNLICEKQVVPELIQHDFNPTRLQEELQSILTPERRKTILADYDLLRRRLDTGDPAKNVAEHIVSTLKQS
ncbi:MAG TPA: lipid-A-disaccharide synthase [Saprospiraceae bacterium]|nr:lipid-A-disaccharide synthase [Saprospiraceae bacterium]